MGLLAKLKKKIAAHLTTQPAAYLKLHGVSYASLSSPANRAVRAELLRALSGQLHEVLRQGNLPVKLHITAEGVFADAGGVLLSTELTDRYFKSPTGANEAEAMVGMLERFGIAPRVILDIGANFGEISLYLAKRYPDAKVFPIEASEDNLRVLIRNISLQLFSVPNIFPVRAVLADEEKEVEFTKGLGSENSLAGFSPYANRKTVRVLAVPLMKVARENGITDVDFMKIDIEGAEPMLAKDLAALTPRAMYIEIGSKNTSQAYHEMLHTILDGAAAKGDTYSMFFGDDAHNEISFEKVMQRKNHPDASVNSFDLWLIKK